MDCAQLSNPIFHKFTTTFRFPIRLILTLIVQLNYHLAREIVVLLLMLMQLCAFHHQASSCKAATVLNLRSFRSLVVLYSNLLDAFS